MEVFIVKRLDFVFLSISFKLGPSLPIMMYWRPSSVVPWESMLQKPLSFFFRIYSRTAISLQLSLEGLAIYTQQMLLSNETNLQL